jgi:hypothetical protein
MTEDVRNPERGVRNYPPGERGAPGPMRVDICPNDDHGTVAALLEALGVVGAVPDDPDFTADGTLGPGLHRFHTAAGQTLTVYADAWGVYLEGPDPLVNRVLAILAGAE